MKIYNICVYCGSTFGNDGAYRKYAVEAGKRFAAKGWNLVYGGGSRGLMGEIALAMKNNGSHIYGYTTKRFHKDSNNEWPADEFKVFDTMHERKMKMFRMSDAFIALPGGMGTLDELAEICTWRQIKYTNKPFVLFNLFGFWDNLIAQMDLMLEQGFTKEEQFHKIKVCYTIDKIIEYLDSYEFEDAQYELK